MRLVHLEISHFRSVELAALTGCGDFNVLIGKNNSGKSNLLSAIDHVFRFLSLQTLATAAPTFSKEIDAHGRDVTKPIILIATLEPNAADMMSIIEAIGVEYPQVQNALPDPTEYRWVQVEIKVIHEPSPVQYLSSLRVSKTPRNSNGMVILEVSGEAAVELAKRNKETKGRAKDSRMLATIVRNFDADDWERFRRRGGGSYLPLDEITPETAVEIRELIEASQSYSDAKTKLDALRITLRERSELYRALNTPLTAFAGPTEIIPEYAKLALSRFAAANVLHLADRRQPIGPSEASRLLQLKMSRGGDATLRSIQDTVRSLLGVQIDAFASDVDRYDRGAALRRGQGRSLPEAELDVDEFLVEVNGSGVKEALRVVLDVEFEKPDILLVEEPEVHLHPALEVAMMQHLKRVSTNSQVFLTTHSTNFLDTGDMRNVYMVRDSHSTQIQHLDVSEAETELPKELGIRLSSIFMFDRLVFVEGQTDELVLRIFAQKLGFNLSQANVGFVLMGGARNFTHYAANATLSLLTKRRVKSFFVLDRDERSERGIEKFAKQLGEQAKLHVLNRREIENYLIDPSGLARYIQLRKGSERPSSDDVAANLADTAEGLKELSVTKRVVAHACMVQWASRERILENWEKDGILTASMDALSELETSVSELKQTVEQVISTAQAEVADRWDEHKLEIVPGSELLDGVLQRYGIRYKKDRDASELAAAMDADDITSELCDLLKNICTTT